MHDKFFSLHYFNGYYYYNYAFLLSIFRSSQIDLHTNS